MGKMAEVKEVYMVYVTRPKGVTVSDMEKYIAEAVECWSRGGHPDDPIWEVGDYPVDAKKYIELKERKK
jgi:hypothetical protein